MNGKPKAQRGFGAATFADFAREKMLACLAKSGLDAAIADKMKIVVEIDGYQIPYRNLKGEPIDFYRKRKFDAPKNKKYVQPKGSLPHAYLSPRIDWMKVKDDTSIPILICEGEKKTERAINAGYTAIGVGGIDSWHAPKRGLDLVEELAGISWSGRPVHIAFDADPKPKTRQSNKRAREALAATLVARGAAARIVDLPLNGNKKQGVDDFLEAHGSATFEALVATASAPVLTRLEQLNSSFALIRSIDRIMEVKTRDLHTIGDFKNGIGMQYAEPGIGDKGPTLKDTVRWWLASPKLNQYHRITYEPGASFPDVMLNKERCLNLWPGLPVEPKQGDIRLWREDLDHIFKGHEDKKQWFKQWCAYPIQHPGAKLFACPVFYSPHEGIGKSLTFKVLGAVYGENFHVLDAEQLHSHFNPWVNGRQLILGEEVTQSKNDMERLRLLITGETITINLKHKGQYDLPNRLNVALTTNYGDALKLSAFDRRFFIWEFPPGLTERFFTRLAAWIATPAGMSALLYDLHNEVLTGFEPKGRPPMTEAKLEMVRSSVSDQLAWAQELKDDPRVKLGIFYRPIMTTSALLQAFVRELGPSRVGGQQMASALKLAGFEKIHPLSRDKVYSARVWVLDADWVSQHSLSEIYEQYANDARKTVGLVPPSFEPEGQTGPSGESGGNVASIENARAQRLAAKMRPPAKTK